MNQCPVCSSSLSSAFEEIILDTYNVQYFSCSSCGILLTETPHWLNEAYSSAITSIDTGICERNIHNANFLEAFIDNCIPSAQTLLDIAGGYGLLTRMLRDKGFDCYSTDKYCENLFAPAFEPSDGFKPDLLVAFEVMEHIPNPVEFINDYFERYQCNTILFSTLTFSGSVPDKEWWYYAFATGQHITFYQPKTLSIIAEKVGCHYWQLSESLHFFSREEIQVSVGKNWSKIMKKGFTHPYSLKRKIMRQSKVWDDYLYIKSGKITNL